MATKTVPASGTKPVAAPDSSSLKNTATDTLSQYTDMLKLGELAGKFSSDLALRFPVDEAPRPDAKAAFAPVIQDIEHRPPPTLSQVPSEPHFGLATLAGLLASNLGSQVTGRPGLAQPLLLQRYNDIRQTQQANADLQNRSEAEKWRDHLNTQLAISQAAYQDAIAQADAKTARSEADRQFILQHGLDAVNDRIKAMDTKQLAAFDQGQTNYRAELAANAELEAAGLRGKGAQNAAAATLETRRKALAGMNATAAQLSTRIKQENGGFLGFGGKRMSDEEFQQQLRNVSSYIDFGDSTVENAATRHLTSLLNERYPGAKNAAKREAALTALSSQ